MHITAWCLKTKNKKRTWPRTLENKQRETFLLPISPPGAANWRSFCSANRDTIREKMARHCSLPSLSFDTIPGLTSISWFTYKRRREYPESFTWRDICKEFWGSLSGKIIFVLKISRSKDSGEVYSFYHFTVFLDNKSNSKFSLSMQPAWTFKSKGNNKQILKKIFRSSKGMSQQSWKPYNIVRDVFTYLHFKLIHFS